MGARNWIRMATVNFTVQNHTVARDIVEREKIIEREILLIVLPVWTIFYKIERWYLLLIYSLFQITLNYICLYLLRIDTFFLIFQPNKSWSFYALQCSFVITNDDARGNNTNPHFLGTQNIPMDRTNSTEHRIIVVKNSFQLLRLIWIHHTFIVFRNKK